MATNYANATGSNSGAGSQMKEFEFRFLEKDGTVVIDRYSMLSNYTAILAGETRADGRLFEVWCGGVCIYKSGIKTVGSLKELDWRRGSSNR